MAKRFTDIGKWKDDWFKTLSPQAKLVWIYLCDDCDHAGIWISDFEVLSIRTGVKVDEIKLKEMLGPKIKKIDKNRFVIPSFFKVQYGSTKDTFKAKQSALAILQNLGVLDDSGNPIEHLPDTQGTLPGQSPDCLSIGIGKGIGISKKGGVGENKPTPEDYEAVYQKYPKKVGKSDGLTKLKKLCTTTQELEGFEKAMLAYVADCKTNDVFLKNFDTFVNSSWRDWLDPSTTSAHAKASGDGIDWDYVFGKGTKTKEPELKP